MVQLTRTNLVQKARRERLTSGLRILRSYQPPFARCTPTIWQGLVIPFTVRPKRFTMKFAVFASLLSAAAAFAPAKQASTSSALSAFENELGA